MQTLTPVGEFAYVHVFRPDKPMEGSDGAPQFKNTILWPHSDDKKLKKIRSMILEVATSKWGKKAEAMLEKGQLNSPLRDGDDKDSEWMHGHYFMTAKSSDRPGCVDADLEDIIDGSELYPGAIGRMDVWFYPYDKAGNKGVGAILNNVQKLEAGERKDGRQSASEAFGKGEQDFDGDNHSSGKTTSKKGKKTKKEDEEPSRRKSGKKKKK